LAFGLYAAPLYLSRVFALSQRDIGYLLWIPPAGWELGYLVWGWAADVFLRDALKPLRWITSLALLGLPLVMLPMTHSVTVTMTLLFLSMFAAGGFVVLSLRYGIQLYSSSRAALITGIGAGSWSAVVAVLMPLIGKLFDQGRFSTACLVTASLPFLGTALWTALHNDNRKPRYSVA
jgi:ACS family hexuronate transporter-like MFS transporter